MTLYADARDAAARTRDRLRVILLRRSSYRALFLHPQGGLAPASEIVLADLRRVCCTDRPTTVVDRDGRVDPIATARNEGKREIWIRVQQALHLDDAKIMSLMDAAEVDR